MTRYDFLSLDLLQISDQISSRYVRRTSFMRTELTLPRERVDMDIVCTAATVYIIVTDYVEVRKDKIFNFRTQSSPFI